MASSGFDSERPFSLVYHTGYAVFIKSSIIKLISMKTFKIFPALVLCVTLSIMSSAQEIKTETIPVSGNCEMCKGNIEKAAKKAGATEADWNVETKSLTLTYNSGATNAAKIQQGIAAVGYDTRDVKAADAAYDKLHDCCKYDRKEMKKDAKPGMDATKAKASCCDKDDCQDKDKKSEKAKQ